MSLWLVINNTKIGLHINQYLTFFPANACCLLELTNYDHVNETNVRMLPFVLANKANYNYFCLPSTAMVHGHTVYLWDAYYIIIRIILFHIFVKTDVQRCHCPGGQFKVRNCANTHNYRLGCPIKREENDDYTIRIWKLNKLVFKCNYKYFTFDRMY